MSETLRKAHNRPPRERVSDWRPEGGFEKRWSGIISRKLRGAGERALREGYRGTLIGLGRIRDVADIDIKLMTETLSIDDLRNILDAYIKWLLELQRGADHVFMQTESERAMQEYHRPIQLLIELLADLRDGSSSAWSVLRQRGRTGPSFNRRKHEFRYRACQTYDFLLSMRATSSEAVEALNEALIRIKASSRLDPNAFGLLTTKVLAAERKKMAIQPLSSEEANRAIATARLNSGVAFLGRLDRLPATQRRDFISSIVTFLVSGYLDQLRLSEPVPSTRR